MLWALFKICLGLGFFESNLFKICLGLAFFQSRLFKICLGLDFAMSYWICVTFWEGLLNDTIFNLNVYQQLSEQLTRYACIKLQHFEKNVILVTKLNQLAVHIHAMLVHSKKLVHAF